MPLSRKATTRVVQVIWYVFLACYMGVFMWFLHTVATDFDSWSATVRHWMALTMPLWFFLPIVLLGFLRYWCELVVYKYILKERH